MQVFPTADFHPASFARTIYKSCFVNLTSLCKNSPFTCAILLFSAKVWTYRRPGLSEYFKSAYPLGTWLWRPVLKKKDWDPRMNGPIPVNFNQVIYRILPRLTSDQSFPSNILGIWLPEVHRALRLRRREITSNALMILSRSVHCNEAYCVSSVYFRTCLYRLLCTVLKRRRGSRDGFFVWTEHGRIIRKVS